MKKSSKRAKIEKSKEAVGFHRHIVPNTWYIKSDWPVVMLLLLARKFCSVDENPFYCDVFPRDLFCRVMTFLASETRLYVLAYGNDEISSNGRLKDLEHYLLLQTYREELENFQNKMTGDAWRFYGVQIEVRTGDFEKALSFYKKAVTYNGAHPENYIDILYTCVDIENWTMYDEYVIKFARCIQDIKKEEKEEWELEFEYIELCKNKEHTEEYAKKILDLLAKIENFERENNINMKRVKNNTIKKAMRIFMSLKKWKDALDLSDKMPNEDNILYNRKYEVAKCHFMLGNYALALKIQLEYCENAEKNCPYGPDELESARERFYQYSRVYAKKIKPDKIKWI